MFVYRNKLPANNLFLLKKMYHCKKKSFADSGNEKNLFDHIYNLVEF